MVLMPGCKCCDNECETPFISESGVTASNYGWVNEWYEDMESPPSALPMLAYFRVMRSPECPLLGPSTSNIQLGTVHGCFTLENAATVYCRIAGTVPRYQAGKHAASLIVDGAVVASYSSAAQVLPPGGFLCEGSSATAYATLNLSAGTHSYTADFDTKTGIHNYGMFTVFQMSLEPLP
jgi:hypothetical protein